MSLIETLLRAPASRRMFARGGDWLTAGDIRALAAGLVDQLPEGGACYLHTASAAHFTAGLLAAAARGKTVVLPAHAQAAYLAEIGCAPDALIDDARFISRGDESALQSALRDPLLIFFTSGSTGAPKPVEKNLSRLEAEVAALDAVWRGEAGHVLATVSHQHIYGLLYRVAWPLLSERTADDIAAAYWEDLGGRMGGATLISSPAHLTRLPPRNELFAPPPTLIFSSGQLLTAEAARACIDAFGKPVTEVLGSTETGGVAWRRQTTPDALWRPLPGVQVSAGEDGALWVRSPHLQSDAPHTTGDTIAIAEGGCFRLLPRGDRVAKIDGKRISLPRIEAALTALPEVTDAAALTLPERKDSLAAIVVLSDAGRAFLQQEGAFRFSRRLRIAAAPSLEPAERPKHWRFVDAIPVNTQGKRVLSDLRALFAGADPLDALNLDVRAQGDHAAEIAFTLAPELVFFRGHFPDRPILPGVAQAHLAVLIAQRLWGAWPSDANLSRLKFRRVLAPGDAVLLSLKYDPEKGRLTFAYGFGDTIASQGEIGGVTR